MFKEIVQYSSRGLKIYFFKFYFILFLIFTVQRRVITIRRWAKITTKIIRGSERVISKFGASPSFGN
jgi:hypothetical protein